MAFAPVLALLSLDAIQGRDVAVLLQFVVGLGVCTVVVYVRIPIARVSATRVVVAVIVVLAAVVSLYVAGSHATSAADRVRAGKAIEFNVVGVPGLAITAQPARVKLGKEMRCVVYLGTSEGCPSSTIGVPVPSSAYRPVSCG